jgi:hypothetical protein
MFFTKILRAEIQSEWEDLIRGTNFKVEWDQHMLNKNLLSLYHGIKVLFSTLELKTVSDELRLEIIRQLNTYFEELKVAGDLCNLIRYMINNTDLTLQKNSLISQKNQITYSIGENNLKPTFTDNIVSYFGQNTRRMFKNNSSNVQMPLICCVLPVGFYFINRFEHSPQLMLLAQLAFIACLVGIKNCVDKSSIETYELRERYQGIITQLRFIAPKLDQVNHDIVLLEVVALSRNNAQKSS